MLKGPLQCSGIGTALRPLWTSEADLSLDKVKRLEIMGGGEAPSNGATLVQNEHLLNCVQSALGHLHSPSNLQWHQLALGQQLPLQFASGQLAFPLQWPPPVMVHVSLSLCHREPLTIKQARKPRSNATLKVCPLTHSLAL